MHVTLRNLLVLDSRCMRNNMMQQRGSRRNAPDWSDFAEPDYCMRFCKCAGGMLGDAIQAYIECEKTKVKEDEREMVKNDVQLTKIELK